MPSPIPVSTPLTRGGSAPLSGIAGVGELCADAAEDVAMPPMRTQVMDLITIVMLAIPASLVSGVPSNP